MAGLDVLANVSNALSQKFASKISKNWNRQAILAAKLPTEAGFGKNVAWDAGFSGASANSYAEGADVQNSELNVDAFVPATLSWGHYRSAFQVSETEFDAAATSSGSADALVRLFDTRVMGSVEKLASKINLDLWTGTGVDGSSNPNIVGLQGGALEASGIYANVNRATYSEWAGNVLSNGGVARPLTIDLMEQMDANIFSASSMKPDMIICDPATFRKYKGIFEPLRRVEGESVMKYDTSMYSEVFFQGLPIFRDKDCPAGTMAFLNSSQCAKVFLPISDMSEEDVFKSDIVEGSGGSGDEVTPTGLPFRIVPLAKNGDSLKFMVKCVLNLKVVRPNCMGYIKDISIT